MPAIFTVAGPTLTKHVFAGQPPPKVSAKTLAVFPVSVTVTRALVKVDAPIVPDVIPVTWYVIGIA
jgi:hypothetical protein